MKKLFLILFLTNCLYGFSQEKSMVCSRESFNDNWKFNRYGLHQDIPNKTIAEPKDLEKSNYDDSEWRKLSLPHDWGIEGPFRNDLENNTGLLPWKAIGWYRKHFIIEQQDSAKQIFIDFDGAMANAKIWLNGKYIGEWPYGYTSFRFNLTPFIKFGKENVIAVRLDTENLDSRWYPGAGIYRNVWIVKTNPVHIDHWGVYLTTPAISKQKALVNLQLNIKNDNKFASEIKVKTLIYNDENKKVAESNELNTTVAALSQMELRQEAIVENPILWDIMKPYLYTARTIIYKNGKPVHIENTSFGIRTIEFTVNNGFLLNGNRIEIKGVCNHHDLGPLGAAFNVRAAERQLEILKEMGCNAIRTSHNPPAPELLDLCDKMGFLVQVEAFDCWKMAKKKNDYNTIYEAWHVEDLKAMINRDKNHPSVFMWSIGNEVQDQNKPEMAKRLARIVRMTDPTRPVTAGCNLGAAGFNGFQKTLDVFGYNYNHWMYEKYFSDSSNATIPFMASETSSCLSSRGEYFFPVVEGRANNNLPGNGIFHMSSYDQQFPGWGLIPDKQFELNEKYPRIMGEFVWTGFDYLGEPTPYNDDITNLLNYKDSTRRARLKKHLEKIGAQEVPSRSSYFGIMDLCGFKKDRFYNYQAHWRPDFPMAHILPHWNWPERKGMNVPVHVYTSGDEAELFLNGKSLGKRLKGKYEYRLKWDSVIYQPGELKVVVWKNGKVWAEDVVNTTDEAYKIQLVADRKEIKADASDLVFVTVNIIDKKSRIVPKADNLVEFEIEGQGEIIAVGNGDPTCHEPFIAHKHSAFNGKCLVIIRSTKKAGTIKLSAVSEGLRKKSIEINVISEQ